MAEGRPILGTPIGMFLDASLTTYVESEFPSHNMIINITSFPKQCTMLDKRGVNYKSLFTGKMTSSMMTYLMENDDVTHFQGPWLPQQL